MGLRMVYTMMVLEAKGMGRWCIYLHGDWLGYANRTDVRNKKQKQKQKWCDEGTHAAGNRSAGA